METKRKHIITMLLVAGVLLVGLSVLQGCKKSGPATAAESDVVKAIVEGTNFCLGCALKKQKGAAAQCSIFGHKHALKVTRAVGEDGKDLTGMRGWVLHYLETEKSRDLIKAHHKQTLTIKGKVYPQERVLEVDSFKGPEATPKEIKEVASAAIQQTTCPVMGEAIDKNMFTEYKGKKVYFCCLECKAKFEKEPGKYIAKLPQFND